MTQHVGLLLALTAGYLGLLFLVARLGDRTRRGAGFSRNPLVSALSLGVYTTAWGYYGIVGFAAQEGWLFLSVFLGATLSCALIPVVWAPLARLARGRQLATLADLFAFRYRSQSAGVLVTLVLLAGNLPYQALQLRAIVRSVEVLTGEGSGRVVGVVTSILLIGLGMLFGARHVTPRERHDGLVLAIAVESVVKLLALLAVSGFAVWGVFGGSSGLDAWLASHPEVLERMNAPARDGPWVSLLLMTFASSFLLPRQWHMAFTEGVGEEGLRVSSWAFPTYLVLVTLALPPILWAGQKLGLGGSPDVYVLALATRSGSPWLTSLVFLGGLSAASAMILVTTLALAGMCQNYLLPPLHGLSPRPDLYRRLLWMRRGLIAVIVVVGHGFFEILDVQGGLTHLGLVSLLAVSQFLPGLAGVLFWSWATLRGFLAGLSVGIGLWGVTVLAPLFSSGSLDLFNALGLDGDPWSFSLALSLGLNTIVFVLVSTRDSQRATEAEAAAICRSEAWTPPPEGVVAGSVDDFSCRLAAVLGAHVAEQEVTRALGDLGLRRDERRPAELWRLRDRIEQNLSGLVGPVRAKMAVDETLSRDPGLHLVVSTLVGDLEARFAEALKGPELELENARRYLRRILEDLPLGVCTLGPGGEIVLWNAALAEVTGIRSEDAVGHPLLGLCEPWGPRLARFAAGEGDRGERTVHASNGARIAQRRVALRKSAVDPAALPEAVGAASAGLVLLVEDRTEQHAMAASLAHRDRLASVGRLATGFAHEINNPLSTISSLAQTLERGESDVDAGEHLRRIVTSSHVIEHILRTLRTFVVPRDPRPVRIAEIAWEALTLARLSRKERGVSMRADVPEDLWVHGDPPQIEQVLMNLLTNAVDASSGGAEVIVRATRHVDLWVCIEVIDSGEGMSPELRARIFEPSFTTKKSGDGMGLGIGLWLVHSIVLDHGGRIEVESAEGNGTRMRVFLPAYEEAT